MRANIAALQKGCNRERRHTVNVGDGASQSARTQQTVRQIVQKSNLKWQKNIMCCLPLLPTFLTTRIKSCDSFLVHFARPIWPLLNVHKIHSNLLFQGLLIYGCCPHVELLLSGYECFPPHLNMECNAERVISVGRNVRPKQTAENRKQAFILI